MTKTFQDNISRGQCVVERVTEQRIFNKCKAYNAGARRALREGAQFLCFLDADTLVASNFFDWLLPRLHNGCFFITALRPNGRDVSDLTGLLALSASDFARSQGFDEAFRGWGSEDIEMRLRLHVLYGLSYADVPLSLIRPIRHDNRLRSLHYVEKDIFRSDQHNFARMLRKLAAWRSKSRSTLGSVDRLLYHTARNAYVPTQPSAQAPLSCMASAQPTMLDGTSK